MMRSDVRLDVNRHPYVVQVCGEVILCASNLPSALDAAFPYLSRPVSVIVETPVGALHRKQLVDLERQRIQAATE